MCSGLDESFFRGELIAVIDHHTVGTTLKVWQGSGGDFRGPRIGMEV